MLESLLRRNEMHDSISSAEYQFRNIRCVSFEKNQGAYHRKDYQRRITQKKIKQCGENAVRPSGPTTQTECRDDGLREAFTSTLKSTDRPSKGEPDGQTESLYLPRVCPDSTRKCNARFPRLCKSETFYHVHVILAVEVSLFFLSFSFFFFFFFFVFIFDTVLRAVICLMLIRYDDVNNFLDSRFNSIRLAIRQTIIISNDFSMSIRDSTVVDLSLGFILFCFPFFR